ncbi:ATPase [Vibrio crassostreae]|nr:ATPase [Vibrio crassostreae]CAK3226372.1 ATPase [Vibrio crassostreae]
MKSLSKKEFQLKDELHNTVVQSLVTSFGLDFLLFEDKKGGNVATINNVRAHQNGDKNIYRSESVQNEYESRGKYNSHAYHSDPNYLARGKVDKEAHQNGVLHDSYRNKKMSQSDKRQLDHIISASEIHNDAGRVLSGSDGVSLANDNSNFQSTYGYINTLKSNHSMDVFLNKKLPETIEKKHLNIQKNTQALNQLGNPITPEQKHKKRQLEDKVRKDQEHLEALESINIVEMKKSDEKARKEYEAEINYKYYTGSKFLKASSFDAAKGGLKMGVRQALGLIFAEVWFELKDSIPEIFKDKNDSFTFEKLLENLKFIGISIWNRIKIRFKDIFEEFKTGMLAGVLSSITTTVMNIFLTTQKTIIKLVREMWSTLVSVAKMVFFNPKKLSVGELTREVVRLLSTGVAVALGAVLNQHLATLLTFPFGSEIAAFLSAVASGLITLGFSYFLDHSEMMLKVWTFLDKYKSNAKRTLEYFQKVNEKLDDFLLELASIEFNLDSNEIKQFTDRLIVVSCEIEKGYLIGEEVKRRKIELPFESNNLDSTRDWLKSL